MQRSFQNVQGLVRPVTVVQNARAGASAHEAAKRSSAPGNTAAPRRQTVLASIVRRSAIWSAAKVRVSLLSNAAVPAPAAGAFATFVPWKLAAAFIKLLLQLLAGGMSRSVDYLISVFPGPLPCFSAIWSSTGE